MATLIPFQEKSRLSIAACAAAAVVFCTELLSAPASAGQNDSPETLVDCAGKVAARIDEHINASCVAVVPYELNESHPLCPTFWYNLQYGKQPLRWRNAVIQFDMSAVLTQTPQYVTVPPNTNIMFGETLYRHAGQTSFVPYRMLRVVLDNDPFLAELGIYNAADSSVIFLQGHVPNCNKVSGEAGPLQKYIDNRESSVWRALAVVLEYAAQTCHWDR